MADVLCAKNVSKAYRHAVVLKPLDLVLRQGEIYGLVGENGAGKSTLIRIINGLTRPTTGTISLFGEVERGSINRQRSRIGYVPDSNALYPDLNARRNLEIRRIEWGIKDEGSIERALGAVGLSSVGNKKVRSYSLGMKRRLDLAAALLGEPEFLILDEPTNGLDPTGIIEIRELLKRLNRDRGVTILISSHILPELHEMATQYLFLSHGKMIEQISADDLDARCGSHILLRVDDVLWAEELIRENLTVERIEIVQENTIRLYGCTNQPHEVTGLLVSNGVSVGQMALEEGSLEVYYTQLINTGAQR